MLLFHSSECYFGMVMMQGVIRGNLRMHLTRRYLLSAFALAHRERAGRFFGRHSLRNGLVRLRIQFILHNSL